MSNFALKTSMEERELMSTSPTNIEEGEQQRLGEVAAAPASSATRLFVRRFVQPAAVLAVATAIGYAGYEMQLQARLRDPVAPAELRDAESEAEADTSDSSFDAFTQLTEQRNMLGPWCPARHLNPWIRCAIGGTCCNNNDGHAYCCAAGNECFRQVCIAGPGQCFPGEAEVELEGGRTKRLNELSIGEHILVETSAKGKQYEPVLSFLHVLAGVHESLMVEHAFGTFRVSANHLVFVEDEQGKRADKIANQVTAGDFIYLGERSVKVLSVHSSKMDSGMYAPLTASGTVVVDGIAASNYASNSLTSWVPHSVIHAAFLPVRAYYQLGFGGKDGVRELHPYADILERYVAPIALQVLGQHK